MYKAVIAPASGIAFVPSGSTTPIVLHPPKAAAGGATSVRYGNLTVATRPGAEDWVPGPEWLSWAGGLVPPQTEVVFARRKEGPKTYGWRAVAERPNGRKGTRILVLVDETETRDSVKWLLLHEFAHALVTATPTLAETLRAEKRPEGYPQNDDAHEAVFEEEVANAFADRLAPVPGLDRRWWRKRTRQAGYGETGLVLPSASSASDFVAGVEGAFPRLVSHMLGRAVLVGTGLYLAGAGTKTVRYALAGSAAIEVFVLWYAWNQQRE